MGNGKVGLVIGIVAMVTGLVLIMVFIHSDRAGLGGAGLIVLGAMLTAISFDDRSGDR